MTNKITADEVKRRLDAGESLVFVDARGDKAWDSSYTKLPGAIRVPPGDADRHLEEIPRGRAVITYCT
jgi:hypothetical protein